MVARTPFGSMLLPSEATGSLYRTQAMLRSFGGMRRQAPVRQGSARQLIRSGSTISAAAVMRAFGPRRELLVPPDPSQGLLRLTASHLGESVRLRPFGLDGAPDPQAFAELAHVMRCRVTGEEVPIDPQLVRILVALGNTYKRPLQLISGHRAAHVNGTSETSQHTAGRAADIKIYGVSINNVRERALELGARGVGLYPENNFVHVDVRGKRRYTWIWTEAEGEQQYE
jgi:uncharacterized protein YcbK (DUF882 family)